MSIDAVNSRNQNNAISDGYRYTGVYDENNSRITLYMHTMKTSQFLWYSRARRWQYFVQYR